MTKRIGVIMGGRSRERDVSLRTGSAILNALEREGADVVGIDSAEFLIEKLKKEKVEVAFIALHGKYGEDGTIQGLLEMIGIPYTGSGVLASALAMNKNLSKKVFQAVGIPTPRFELLESEDLSYTSNIPFPLVVKPSSEGSTFGISIVRKADDLGDAIKLAFSCDSQVLVEEFIDGTELTVGILGEEALPVIEIVPSGGFYDYKAKYTKGMTEYIVPAKIDDGMAEVLQKIAIDAHNTLGCRGVSRVDYRLDKDSNPYVLEVNTIPGMTETSLLPKAAAKVGYSFGQLVLKILEYVD